MIVYHNLFLKGDGKRNSALGSKVSGYKDDFNNR